LYNIPDEEAQSAALRDFARRDGSQQLFAPPVPIGPGRLPELLPAAAGRARMAPA
jgi:hypothetical protein